MAGGPDPNDTLTTLRTLLDSASRVVADLAHDPQIVRLIHLFSRLPLEDHPVLLSILEREVGLRVATGEGASTFTGIGARMNPNARLYLRSLDKSLPPASALEHDELVFTTVRATRMMRMVLRPEIHERWRAAQMEAFDLLEPAEREEFVSVVREVLEMAMGSTTTATKVAS
jgi:hypothetical protein